MPYLCAKNNNLYTLKDNEEKLHTNSLDVNYIILHGNWMEVILHIQTQQSENILKKKFL
jgi:hypothetical protein